MEMSRAIQESCSTTVKLDGVQNVACRCWWVAETRDTCRLSQVFSQCLFGVQVLVGGRDDQDVFMVMEFLEHDLKGLLEQGRLKDFGPSDVSVLRLDAGDSLLQTQDAAAGAEVPKEASAMNNQSHLLHLSSQGPRIGLRKACPGLAWCISLRQPRGGSAREVWHHCLTCCSGNHCISNLYSN